MKNQRMQKLLRASKARTSEPGILSSVVAPNLSCHHVLGDERAEFHGKEDKRSWWVDFAFVLGSRRVSVAYQHVRMSYLDAVENKVYTEIQAPDTDWPFGKSGTPNYRRVGRSRKKAVSWTMEPCPADHSAYFAERNERVKVVQATGDITVKPEMRIVNTAYSRLVYLSAWDEFWDAGDLCKIRDRIIRVLSGEQFSEVFGAVYYSAIDWNKEQV